MAKVFIWFFLLWRNEILGWGLKQKGYTDAESSKNRLINPDIINILTSCLNVAEFTRVLQLCEGVYLE